MKFEVLHEFPRDIVLSPYLNRAAVVYGNKVFVLGKSIKRIIPINGEVHEVKWWINDRFLIFTKGTKGTVGAIYDVDEGTFIDENALNFENILLTDPQGKIGLLKRVEKKKTFGLFSRESTSFYIVNLPKNEVITQVKIPQKWDAAFLDKNRLYILKRYTKTIKGVIIEREVVYLEVFVLDFSQKNKQKTLIYEIALYDPMNIFLGNYHFSPGYISFIYWFKEQPILVILDLTNKELKALRILLPEKLFPTFTSIRNIYIKKSDNINILVEKSSPYCETKQSEVPCSFLLSIPAYLVWNIKWSKFKPVLGRRSIYIGDFICIEEPRVLYTYVIPYLWATGVGNFVAADKLLARKGELYHAVGDDTQIIPTTNSNVFLAKGKRITYPMDLYRSKFFVSVHFKSVSSISLNGKFYADGTRNIILGELWEEDWGKWQEDYKIKLDREITYHIPNPKKAVLAFSDNSGLFIFDDKEKKPFKLHQGKITEIAWSYSGEYLAFIDSEWNRIFIFKYGKFEQPYRSVLISSFDSVSSLSLTDSILAFQGDYNLIVYNFDKESYIIDHHKGIKCEKCLISPDGRKIGILRNSQLIILNLHERKEIQPIKELKVDNFSWSEDSNGLIIVTKEKRKILRIQL